MGIVAPSRLIEEGRLPALIFAGAALLGTTALVVAFFVSPDSLKSMVSTQLSNIILTSIGASSALSGWVTHNKRKEKEAEQGTSPRLHSISPPKQASSA